MESAAATGDPGGGGVEGGQGQGLQAGVMVRPEQTLAGLWSSEEGCTCTCTSALRQFSSGTLSGRVGGRK